MEILADLMLGIGAIGAGIYCMVLSKRLRRFNNLQNGMGGAVAVLSAQVDDMTTMLNVAQDAAKQSAIVLTDLTERAENSAKKLELLMASLHDLPEAGSDIAHQSPTQPKDHHSSPQNEVKATEPPRPVFVSHRVLEAAQ